MSRISEESCFTFRIAVIGEERVGKSHLVRTWQSITSFDKFINGAPRPPLDDFYGPTRFVEYVPIEVVVKDCKEAAAHRVFLLDTPGAPELQVLREGLISKSSMREGVNGVILLVDGRHRASSGDSTADAEHDEAREEAVRKQALWCLDNDCLVLLIHRGAKIPQGLRELGPMVTLVATEDLEKGLKEETQALVGFVEALHTRAAWLYDGAQLAKAELERHIQAAHGRHHPRTLPSRKVEYTVQPGKRADATRELCVGLLGGPATGKSAFMASLVDGFPLHHHEPTLQLEAGTLALNLPPGEIVNVTLLDGPGVALQPKLAIGLLFIDLSNPFALEAAAAVIDQFTPGRVPPLFVLLCTKADLGVAVADDDLTAFAAELNAAHEEIDPRKNNEPLFARIVAAAIDGERAVVTKLHRERAVFEATVRCGALEIPHTAADIRALFTLLDAPCRGYVGVDAVRRVYADFDKAQLGDFEAALRRARTVHCTMQGGDYLSFEQFSIIMCELARL